MQDITTIVVIWHSRYRNLFSAAEVVSENAADGVKLHLEAFLNGGDDMSLVQKAVDELCDAIKDPIRADINLRYATAPIMRPEIVNRNGVIEMTEEDLLKEVWIDARGYEDLYEVSNMGRVRNAKTQRLLKIQEQHGRRMVFLNKYGEQRSFTVARLCYMSFNPMEDYKQKNMYVFHKDGNILNDRLKNLTYGLESTCHSLSYELGKCPHNDHFIRRRKQERLDMKTRLCRRCHKEKQISAFEVGRTVCKKCRGEREKWNRKKNMLMQG